MMTQRLVRFAGWWVGIVVLGLGIVRAAPTDAPPAEAPAPQPATAVQRLLEEIDAAIAVQRLTEALAVADRAVAAAQEAGDAAGEAGAQRRRAVLLARLNRTEEAVAAWREAAGAWERAGDGPGQVEALAMAGVLLAAGKPAESEALIARAVSLGRTESRRPQAAAEALHRGGLHSYIRRLLRQARSFWEAAAAIRESHAPDSSDLAASLNGLGILAQMRGDLAAAGGYHRRALEIHEKVAPGSLDVATSLGNLGILAQQRGDLAGARKYQERALAIQENQAPDSLLVAPTLGNLANLAFEQGDLAGARKYHERVLALQERLAPDSLDLAGCLNNLGLVTHRQGDLVAARQFYRRALGMIRARAPRSLDAAQTVGNLASVAFEAGELAAARQYYSWVLAIQEELAPGSLTVAATLNNLGNVADEQGDLVAASDYYRRALAIQQELAPDSLAVAASLGNLANVSNSAGEFRTALRQYRDSLVLLERLAPDSLEAANCLNNLGNVALTRGDRAAAAAYFRRALGIQQRRAPSSLAVASSLANLGVAALKRGELAAARRYHQRALAIKERLAPRSLDVAASLNNLGIIALRQGNRREAERQARRAWALVLQQAAIVSGDEARQAFGAAAAPYAANLVQAQLALGQTEAAFRTLEEGRAQALLQLLAERRLLTDQTLLAGPAGRRLQLDYHSAVSSRDRAQEAFARATAAEAAARRSLRGAEERRAAPEEVTRRRSALAAAARQVDAAESAYTQARLRVDRLWAEIKGQVPHTFVRPLSTVAARRSLPPGTLFAAFLVGQERTHLFLLQAGPNRRPSVMAYPVALSTARLRERVRTLAARASERLADPEALTAASRSLFVQLFPAASRPALRQARRLLISPDGPLWEVPFAALVMNQRGTPRYLGLEKPLTYTQSLTLFAQARAHQPRRIQGGKPVVLALGNPLFDRRPTQIASTASTLPVRGGERGFLMRDGKPPAPLPATGREAEAVARVYAGQPLLRTQADEAAVRQAIQGADVVHLATHGYLHPVLAMSSGLLLTAPEREPEIGETENDGVLQAWEIYSQLRLRAELVVLSACETGRGENVRAEGIVGLTRALQYAGARSVVASQWAVADESTARLMVAFHRKLRRGLDKDEALRQAMAEVRGNTSTSLPYHWAAFFLTGDPENPGLGRQPERPIRRRAGRAVAPPG